MSQTNQTNDCTLLCVQRSQTSNTNYVAYFPSHGYYAAKQPTYDWCFTDDFKLAHLWKKRKGAEDRVEWGAGLRHHPSNEIKYPDGTVKTIVVTTTFELIDGE